MKKELFPLIETNYKADPGNRSLIGCSLGGLITLYTLFTQPELFTGYVAASPAIGWDKEVLYKYEKTFSKKTVTNPIRVYLTEGDVERGLAGFEICAAKLSGSNHANVSILSKVLDNTGHRGTKSGTYSRGLQYIFEKSKLNLDAATLNKYAGTYLFANGNKIELNNENNQLTFYFSPAIKYNLFAASETEFYSTNEFFNIYFKKENDKITGFDLAKYGTYNS
jgi:pimeloyl-ACP methyl ester carboxylesterase